MRFLLFCAGTAACVAASASEIDPAALLAQSAAASRISNYQGVVIYRGDDRFEVLRVQHQFKDDSERERMVSLTGEPRQLLRIDNRLICILPKGRTMSVQGPSLKGVLSQLTAARIEQLKQFYDFRDDGPGRIAGRACNGVTVIPRDEYRYGYEVWLDKESKLPLKISLIGAHSDVLEQVMFTEIAFPDSIPDSAFETEVDINKFNLIAGSVPTLDSNPPPDNGEPQVRLDKLPPGFKIIAHDNRPMPEGNGQVEHLLLSDGLSAVSVFSAVQQQQVKAFSGISHMGAMQAYGRRVGSFHVTIIGEVPLQTIRLIGDGLHVPIPELITPDSPAEQAPSVIAAPSAPAPVSN